MGGLIDIIQSVVSQSVVANHPSSESESVGSWIVLDEAYFGGNEASDHELSMSLSEFTDDNNYFGGEEVDDLELSVMEM